MKPNSTRITPLHPLQYEEIVDRALLEDLGRAGDITTDAIVSAENTATAEIVARAPGRIAGVEIAGCVFRRMDARLLFEARTYDGTDVETGDTIAVVRGGTGAILSGERTALNFLSHLSGIATATRDIVAIVAPYSARVVCTRKTTPGLRVLEKYAVRAGGGFNHRFGLDDAVLVSDLSPDSGTRLELEHDLLRRLVLATTRELPGAEPGMLSGVAESRDPQRKSREPISICFRCTFVRLSAAPKQGPGRYRTDHSLQTSP